MTSTRQTRTVARGSAPRSRTQALSGEQIVAATRAFLDEHGFDAFSMRRLAEHLGVGTMTLYTYFRDKDELLDAVIDAGAAELRLPPRKGPWRPRLEQVLRELRRGLERHPDIVRLRVTRPIVSPGALRVGEAGLEALRDAGLGPREAALAWRTLFNFTFGFAAFTPGETPEPERRQARATLLALPPEEYPEMVALAAEGAAALGGEEPFEFGLALLLDAIGALVPPPPR
jgi:AcrR family transcriptional regulator